MASYYVDFENVGSLGMDGTSLLTAADTVYIFYSNKADTMKMDVVAQIYNTSAQIVFEKVELGTPNALDFQLLTDLFCTIQNSQGESYIISKDTGYDVAVKRGRAIYNFKLWRKKSIRLAIEASVRNDNESRDSEKEVKPVKKATVETENGIVDPVVKEVAAEIIPETLAVISGDESAFPLNMPVVDEHIPSEAERQEEIVVDLQETTDVMMPDTETKDVAETADVAETKDVSETAEMSEAADVTEPLDTSELVSVSGPTILIATETTTAENEKENEMMDEAMAVQLQEPEAQKIEASEEEPAIEAEVHEKAKRSRNRSRRRSSQRRKENQNVEEVVSETGDQDGTEAVETEPEVKVQTTESEAEVENNALIASPLPAELIVIDQKPPIKLQKRSGNKRNDNRKNHEKPVMTSLPEEIRYLLKSQCDMDITDGECDIVIKAVGSSNNKGEFYHCFRREMGDAKGREFYLRIRSCFDSIRKLAKKYE